MTATSHALIGTIIAAKFSNPALAIPIALASHVVADMIPHWDESVGKKDKNHNRLFFETFGDVILGFALSYTLITFFFPKTDLAYAFIMIIVAQLPDWLTAPYYFFKIKSFEWAYKFGKKTNIEIDKPWGVITQVGFVALLVFLAKAF